MVDFTHGFVVILSLVDRNIVLCTSKNKSSLCYMYDGSLHEIRHLRHLSFLKESHKGFVNMSDIISCLHNFTKNLHIIQQQERYCDISITFTIP